MKTFLGEMCKPAGIYLLLSTFIVICTALYIAINRIVTTGAAIMNGAITFIFVAIWTYILGFLCRNVSSTLVWILVAINFILVAISMLSVAYGYSSISDNLVIQDNPPPVDVSNSTVTTTAN